MSGYDERADFEHHQGEVTAMQWALSQAGADASLDGTHILDIGGGGGGHAGFLAARARRVTTVDVVDPNVTYGGEFLRLLKEKYARHGVELDIARVEFQRADAMDLPYKDGLFDLVASFNAFEHIPDPEKALREALRVTRPGGYLYITFDPIWTADTGSHFAGLVPEPWAHLVMDADSFAGKMASAGAQTWQIDEFRGAMNKVRLAEFERIFAGVEADGLGTIDFRNAWSGTVDPAATAHENFRAARALGYSEEELLARGLTFILRRPAHGTTAARGREERPGAPKEEGGTAMPRTAPAPGRDGEGATALLQVFSQAARAPQAGDERITLNVQQQAELNEVRRLKGSGEVHDPDFRCFRNMGESRELAIVDVGANRGQSIVSLKAVLPDARIVAFEANSFFGPVLSEVAAWYEGVEVFNVGLGRADERAVLRVPVVDGRYYWEEGSIRPDSFEKPWVKARLASYGAELRFDEYAVEIRRADSMLRNARADIVKIDVEGAEMDVLSAMEDLLDRSRPVFMIENSDWHNVTAWFSKRDYLCYQYRSDGNVLIPFSQACTNAFYLPAHYDGPLASIMRR